MREQPQWEKEIREAYQHLQRRASPRRLHSSLVLYVSRELAMEIQDTPQNARVNIEISRNEATWQGIPVRLNYRLNPGCFTFEGGEEND